MIRSLAASKLAGANYLALKHVNDVQYGTVARVMNGSDQEVNDAMGVWKWHAENVRVQSAAILALVACREAGIRAQRQDDPEVPRQRSTGHRVTSAPDPA